MDIGRAFTFAFEDEDWLKKIAIGGVVNLIPIVDLMAIGYALRALKNMLEGQELPLPEWDSWGDDFMRGLIPTIAGLVYSIPAWIFTSIGSAMAGSDSGFVSLLGLGFSCLTFLYGVVAAIVLPAMFIEYAKTNEFSAFWAFADAFAFIRENLSNYIVAVLMCLVAFIAASIVGGIACGIGIIFTSFIAMLVSAHLLSQVVREAEGSATTADSEM